MSNILTLINQPIRRDSAGRYCLNDLHKAAGGLPHHKPSEWLRNKSTKAAIALLASEETVVEITTVEQGAESEAGIPASPLAPVTAKKDGPFELRGTYIVKELVYAYAMWISPEFYIKVIRAYDALVTGNYIKPLTQAEKYWFSRRPHWQTVRDMVFDGATYAQAGQRLTPPRSATSVGYAIRRMIAVGLINPVEFIRLRYFPETAQRLIAANKQMCLSWGVAE